ncbi:hypothetical protein EIN_178100, partial [Entamoeba invadens IP1]
MVITSVVSGSGTLDSASIKSTLFEAMSRHPRLMRRVSTFNTFYILEDCKVDMDDHIIIEQDRLSQHKFLTILNTLKSQNLDFSKPLWKFHIFTNVAGKWKFVAQISHCHVDGASAVRLLSDITNYTNCEQKSLVTPPLQTRPTSNGNKHQFSFSRSLKMLFAVSYHFIRAIVCARDCTQRLRKIVVGRQKCYWGQLGTISDIKSIATKCNGRLNSLLFSCLSDTIQSITKERCCDDSVKFYVATNMRGYEDNIVLGNNTGLLLLELYSEHNLKLRVKQFDLKLKESKSSCEMVSYHIMMSIIGASPDFFEKFGITIMDK